MPASKQSKEKILDEAAGIKMLLPMVMSMFR